MFLNKTPHNDVFEREKKIKRKKEKKGGGGGGGGAGCGSTLTYLSDEVRHLLLTAASPIEPKCENLPDI